MKNDITALLKDLRTAFPNSSLTHCAISGANVEGHLQNRLPYSATVVIDGQEYYSCGETVDELIERLAKKLPSPEKREEIRLAKVADLKSQLAKLEAINA